MIIVIHFWNKITGFQAEAVDSEEDDEDEENAGEHSVDFDVDYNVHRPADQHTQVQMVCIHH